MAENGEVLITPFPDTDPIHKRSNKEDGAKKDEPVAVKQEDDPPKKDEAVIAKDDYKVGNTLPKELVDTFEPFTVKRWEELGFPLCAVKRSKRRADDTHIFTMAKFHNGGPGMITWILEDVSEERAWDCLSKEVGDFWAEQGSVLITPFPDTDPIHKPRIKDDGAKKDEPVVKQEDKPVKQEDDPPEKEVIVIDD